MSKIEWEIGAKYLTRDGTVVVLQKICEGDNYPYYFDVNDEWGFSTVKSGAVYGTSTGSDKDIIKKLEEKSMKPHKWAKEIHAWADGSVIQCRENNKNTWADIEGVPCWSLIDGVEYRIKPDPIKVKYRVGLFGGGHDYWTVCSNDNHGSLEVSGTFIRWIPDANGNIDYEVEV